MCQVCVSNLSYDSAVISSGDVSSGIRSDVSDDISNNVGGGVRGDVSGDVSNYVGGVISGTMVGGEVQWSSVFVVSAADGGPGLQQQSDGTYSIILGSVVKRSLLVQKSPSLWIS